MHIAERFQAMATLAFDKPEACPVPEYGRLFSEERWQSLASLFASEARKCVGLPDRTSLELCLQVSQSVSQRLGVERRTYAEGHEGGEGTWMPGAS